MKVLTRLVDIAKGKISANMPRSDKWPTVRAQHLKINPTCAVCGGTAKLEVHHIRPFHLHPDLELNMTNLVTLCESDDSGVNCHLFVGHLGNFKSFNVDVLTNAADWFRKISNRPLNDGE